MQRVQIYFEQDILQDLNAVEYVKETRSNSDEIGYILY